jgi:3-hydroxyisobutyrate dehydrogenase
MSTVRPATHIAVAKAVEAAGGRFIECPVGGSVKVASEGKLLGFAGGDAADVDSAREVLGHLCRRIDHAGPMGAGAALKLAINLPLLVYWQALGEAVSVCEGYGFDPEWLIEMFSESSGGANVLKVRGPTIAKALRGEEVPATADVRTMRKDLGLMLAEAKAKGTTSPLVEQVYASFGRAEDAGLAGLDCSAFPAYFARKGNRAG